MGHLGWIDATPARELFEELVTGALERTRVSATPLASRYLGELLEQRVRELPTPPGADGAPEALAEGLLAAQQADGALRLARLQALGDRALFVAGFFGDWLTRRPVGLEYYGDAGRLAYGSLSVALDERAWSHLFEELADRFRDFVEVLTEVGDAARARAEGGELALFERYLRTGSTRDRRRLARRGLLVPVPRPRALQ